MSESSSVQKPPESRLTIENGVLKEKPNPVTEPITEQANDRLKIEQKANSGANWFFWIAALSVINTLVTMADFGFYFPVGLGITQIVDAFAIEAAAAGRMIVLAVNIALASTFVFFGVMSRKRNDWAFLVGLSLYALDAALFVFIQDWLSIGFHAWGCIGIYSGYKAARMLQSSGHTLTRQSPIAKSL